MSNEAKLTVSERAERWRDEQVTKRQAERKPKAGVIKAPAKAAPKKAVKRKGK